MIARIVVFVLGTLGALYVSFRLGLYVGFRLGLSGTWLFVGLAAILFAILFVFFWSFFSKK